MFNLVGGAASENSLNPAIQKEAAAFAVAHAGTPKEYVDYYEFYVALAGDPASQATASSRGRMAEGSLEALTPLLFGALSCPEVTDVPTPQQLNTVVRDWLSRGNRLGFARLSRAVSQMGQFANLRGATGNAVSQAINQYLDQAARYILAKPASAVTLSQDGGEHRYAYDA